MDRRDFVWNMIGSTVYAVISMLLGAAVTRILGVGDGGIFFFAFSTVGQHIYIISYFGMRPVQVTDTGRSYSYGDYRRLRIITCAAAAVASLLFALIYSGLSKKAAVIIIVALFKVLDGFADVCESEYQRDGRLYLTGISLTVRSAAAMAVFTAAMLVTGDLIASCVAMLAGQAVCVALGGLLPLHRMPSVDKSVTGGSTKKLFDAGKWLFLSAFLDMFIFSASKYAVDMSMSAEYSGYYSLLFIPTSVVNLMAGFVIRPVLTKLSRAHEHGRRGDFTGIILKISGLIAAFTLIGIAGAYLLGIPALTLLAGSGAGEELNGFRMTLVILIAGGGFYALANLLYYALVILKSQKVMFIIYAVLTAAAFALAIPAAGRYGLYGAAFSYLTSMLLLAAGFAAVVICTIRKDRNYRQ